MKSPGLLIVISGPSGTGKGTICKALFKKQPDLFYSVSATTRAPRLGEIDGQHYHFLSKNQFGEMLDNDQFLEWAEVYDNRYGTPKKPVLQALSEGKDVILEIDIQGAIKVKQKAPNGIYIFVVPPSLQSLKERIFGRNTDTVEVITKRLSKTCGELQYLHEYNYVVVNDNLEDAVRKVQSIIDAEHCRALRYCVKEEPTLIEPVVIGDQRINLEN